MSSVETIDTHWHAVPPAFNDALERYADKSGDGGVAQFAALLKRAHDVGEVPARVEKMAAAGIDRAVLSLPPPGLFLDDAALAADLCRRANDELMMFASEHSPKLCILASVPLPYGDEAIAELDRLASEDLVRGVGLMTQTEPWGLDDPRCVKFFEAAAERQLPVVLHGSVDGMPSCMIDWNMIAGLGMLFSSTMSVLRLIYSGLLDRAPDLEPIVTHLGGTLPFVVQRVGEFGEMSGVGTGDAKHLPVHYCRHQLYYDTCLFDQVALRAAVDKFGADRLVLGSDNFLAEATSLIDDSHLGADEQAAIRGGTAARWFGART